MDSLYQIVGVRPDATVGHIEAACLRLGETYHPERDPGDEDAARKFKQIEHAYAVLIDPTKRAAYDVVLSAQQQNEWVAPRPN